MEGNFYGVLYDPSVTAENLLEKVLVHFPDARAVSINDLNNKIERQINAGIGPLGWWNLSSGRRLKIEENMAAAKEKLNAVRKTLESPINDVTSVSLAKMYAHIAELLNSRQIRGGSQSVLIIIIIMLMVVIYYLFTARESLDTMKYSGSIEWSAKK